MEQLEGEITPEIEQALMINQNELQNKSIAYHSAILSKESFNDVIDNEIKRLQALKKRNNNLIDKLKNSLINAIEIFGDLTVGTNKFSLRKSERVEVGDVNLLPKEFKTTKIVETADKIAIKKALKLGQKVDNCYLIESNNLKIN